MSHILRDVTQGDVIKEQKQLDEVINNLLSENMMMTQGLNPAKGGTGER